MAALTSDLWRLFLLAVILLAGYGVGAMLLRLARLDERPAIAQVKLLLAVTLGLGVLSYSTLLIGLLGGLNKPVIWMLLIALGLAGVWAAKGIPTGLLRTNLRQAALFFTGLKWHHQVLVGFIVLFGLINLIGALAPPLRTDDLKYHLAIPKRYVSNGAITYLPDYGYSNLPFTMEMLWTQAIAVDSGELPQLINWSIGLLVLGWIWALGRRAGMDKSLIVLAGVLFYTITNVGYQSRSGGVELGGTLFFLATLFVLLVGRGEKSRLLLAGVLAGLYAGSKLPNAIMVVLLTLWVIVASLRASRSVRTSLTAGFLVGASSLVVVSVWYVKAFIMTGNPVYPFLHPLLGGPSMNLDLLPRLDAVARYHWPLPELLDPSVSTYLRQLWLLIANPQELRGHVSPLFVGLLPVMLVNLRRENRELRQLLALAGLFCLYWVASYPFMRIGLPFFALLALPGACAFRRVVERGVLSRWIVSVALGAWLLTSLAGHLREVLPAVTTVLGIRASETYIDEHGSRRTNFHYQPAYQFMNEELPSNATILLWTNYGYYVDRHYFYAIEFIIRMANGERLYDPEQVVSELKRFKITHVAMTNNYLRKPLRQALEASGQLDCIYQDSHMVVCALTPVAGQSLQ